VPLDPAYPTARLAWMLEDAAPVAILAQAHLADRVPAEARNLMWLDGPAACSLEAPAAPLALTATPDHLAYVLYTSGSTGRPKGVMVSHKNAVNLRAALRRALYADIADRPLRVTVNAPVVFDSSVKQLLTLFDGHCLYPVPEDLRRDAERFVEWLGEHRIDVLDATPSLLSLLLDAGLLADPARAPRHVLVGGEAISPALWRTLQRSPSTVFHNVYGPTECTVNATAHTVCPGDAMPVIGRALANMRVYVLDAALRPVPPGVTGELVIGGAGVARGYHARAALTAERFVPDPFARVPGARMYRTGDLGRTSADGELVFGGRADSQVKLRGYRIELHEIEAALLEHPDVQRCVVLVQPGRSPGGEHLAAYVVPRPGHSPAPRALRELLAARLPEHMVPASVAMVGDIPLTINKKVDLAALRAAVAPVTPPPGDPSRGPIEDLVLTVLSELLGRSAIGVDQDFFT
jgi:amino acid adenylation domain-containing protein